MKKVFKIIIKFLLIYIYVLLYKAVFGSFYDIDNISYLLGSGVVFTGVLLYCGIEIVVIKYKIKKLTKNSKEVSNKNE